MSFSKGTNVLTIDGWMKIEHIYPGEKLWGGGGITKVQAVHQSLESPLIIKGKGVKVQCTSLQTFSCRDGYSYLAKEIRGKELEFIQMGEEKKPVFDTIKYTKGILTCYHIIIDGSYYVQVGEETGVLIN